MGPEISVPYSQKPATRLCSQKKNAKHFLNSIPFRFLSQLSPFLSPDLSTIFFLSIYATKFVHAFLRFVIQAGIYRSHDFHHPGNIKENKDMLTNVLEFKLYREYQDQPELCWSLLVFLTRCTRAGRHSASTKSVTLFMSCESDTRTQWCNKHTGLLACREWTWQHRLTELSFTVCSCMKFFKTSRRHMQTLIN
jgi:hypothetical protein